MGQFDSESLKDYYNANFSMEKCDKNYNISKSLKKIRSNKLNVKK